ncbi:hypothetical protein [Kitasatospora albolonga]|uniref:hypothetical protein n=1 Tax=Kitasatospora albolonga TaxID=68173 RepID=UPI003CD06A6B
MDANAHGTTNGTKAVAWTCNGQANQQWLLNANRHRHRGAVGSLPGRGRPGPPPRARRSSCGPAAAAATSSGTWRDAASAPGPEDGRIPGAGVLRGFGTSWSRAQRVSCGDGRRGGPRTAPESTRPAAAPAGPARPVAPVSGSAGPCSVGRGEAVGTAVGVGVGVGRGVGVGLGDGVG